MMPGRDIIVIGASAGGIEALRMLVKALPADLPAAVMVVVHLPSDSVSVLPRLLSRAGPLPATHPADGEAIRQGHIYVAPPDRHLLVMQGYVQVRHGPRENGHRPAVDPLFRSAARAYGRRVIGVILSGTLDDGAAGLLAVKTRGGAAVVQHPDDAIFDGMPRSAIAAAPVDHVVPIAEMAATLTRLTHIAPETKGGSPVPEEMEYEVAASELDMAALESEEKPGVPSVFGCPECGGVLWEMQEGDVLRYRCRVGHAMTAETLLAEQTGALEAALWTALRALEEKAQLARQLGERARETRRIRAAERFEGQARDARRNAALIRDVLLKGLNGGEIEPEMPERGTA